MNPAMGWLFAVALGLHRNSRVVVLGSLVPIALGHALAIATAAAVVVAAGAVIEMTSLRRASGVVLIGWALYHLLYGGRHRVRVGMQTGAAGLVLWSFLMAGAHGAGLMVAPALIPLCLTSGPAAGFASNSVLTSLAAVGLHTTAMLLTTGVVAVVIYEWVGVGFLRRGWINLDMLWVAALLVTGLVLLLT
ncbi:MAG TPA: hypothetical protein VFW75_13380 [Acetobacteraceae bacterium]|nr:hypothetical protein [Acetobacteraceae bacterium]